MAKNAKFSKNYIETFCCLSETFLVSIKHCELQSQCQKRV